MNENLYLTANKYNLLNFDLINILDPVYPLHKVQGHSTQRHCLIFSLKESKFAEFFIWRGSKFHIWLALYAIEYRPYLSVLGPISHEKVKCRILHQCFETANVPFIMSSEIPFRHLYTSVIREFKHRWCEEISLIKPRSSS